MVDVLKDILIEAEELDRYFDGQVPINLWRAKKKTSIRPVFDLVEEPFALSNGNMRPADISIEMRNGEPWVLVKTSPRGVSTFDKPDIFKGNGWEYYRIPAGTTLPHGLAITRDTYRKRFGATHYTLAPAWDMQLKKFKELLRMLVDDLVLEDA